MSAQGGWQPSELSQVLAQDGPVLSHHQGSPKPGSVSWSPPGLRSDPGAGRGGAAQLQEQTWGIHRTLVGSKSWSWPMLFILLEGEFFCFFFFNFLFCIGVELGLPGGTSGKEAACQCKIQV